MNNNGEGGATPASAGINPWSTGNWKVANSTPTEDLKIVHLGTSSMRLNNGRWEQTVTTRCENYVEAVAKIALWIEEGRATRIEKENGTIHAIGETSYAL